ncbi:acyl--CoA ligase [bacterium]|nr:acyl--CoA ligase [bacterium]
MAVTVEHLTLERIKSSMIGVGISNSVLFFAALFFSWKNGLAPVLFDPESPNDMDRLSSVQPDIVFLCDRSHSARLSERTLILTDEMAQCDHVQPTDVFPDDEQPIVAFLTSGSTGESKVVFKKGYQIYRQIEILPDILTLADGFQTVCLVPYYHILGFLYGVFLPLCYGGQTHNTGALVPTALKELLLRERPDLVVGTAVHYRLLDSIWEPGSFLTDTLFMSSGAPLDLKIARSFAQKSGREILEMYGSTETGGCAHRLDDHDWEPYPGVRFTIDQDTLHLKIKSPWSESPESWVMSHDLAEPTAKGFRLLGRDGSLAKIGGKRFSTREVEEVLKEHPRVNDAAVLVSGRPNEEPALFAFVEVQSENQLTLGELRSFLRTRLAHFKVPRTIHLRTELPRTKLKKINYASLQKELETE